MHTVSDRKAYTQSWIFNPNLCHNKLLHGRSLALCQNLYSIQWFNSHRLLCEQTCGPANVTLVYGWQYQNTLAQHHAPSDLGSRFTFVCQSYRLCHWFYLKSLYTTTNLVHISLSTCVFTWFAVDLLFSYNLLLSFGLFFAWNNIISHIYISLQWAHLYLMSPSLHFSLLPKAAFNTIIAGSYLW